MNGFTTKYADRLVGTLSGFDRLVFRGTLRRLSFVEGLRVYLSARQVLLKEFGTYAQAVTERVKEMHSYDTPAILVIPIESVDSGYLAWLTAETERPAACS